MQAKTIQDIVSLKSELEKDVRELINDFQSVSGCIVEDITLKRTQSISEGVGPVYQVEFVVRLPRKA